MQIEFRKFYYTTRNRCIPLFKFKICLIPPFNFLQTSYYNKIGNACQSARRHYFIMHTMHRGGGGSERGESDGLIHQRPLLGRNLSHNRDKNFFSNSPQISSKAPPFTAVDSRLWMRGGVPARIPRVSIAAHSRVSFQLMGGIWSGPLRPNGSLEFETMIWASRAARSDASSKAFMALFRGSASLFIRIGWLFFHFLFLSSLFIAAPLRLRSSFSRPRRFPFPHDIAICILLHAMSRDSVNSKDCTKRFGEFNVSALLSDDNCESLQYDDFSCWKESSYIKY